MTKARNPSDLNENSQITLFSLAYKSTTPWNLETLNVVESNVSNSIELQKIALIDATLRVLFTPLQDSMIRATQERFKVYPIQ